MYFHPFQGQVQLTMTSHWFNYRVTKMGIVLDSIITLDLFACPEGNLWCIWVPLDTLLENFSGLIICEQKTNATLLVGVIQDRIPLTNSHENLQICEISHVHWILIKGRTTLQRFQMSWKEQMSSWRHFHNARMLIGLISETKEISKED